MNNKIVCSNEFQLDVRGANGNPFHVLGYHGVTGMKWKVTKCITRNVGRMVYVPVEKGTMKKGAGKGKGSDTIAPLAVADLAPPDPNETVGDAFDDLVGIIDKEGNPDKVDMGQDIAIKSKKNARRMKSPIKTK